jgi:Holliday junction resolvase-like predicted endonuclease
VQNAEIAKQAKLRKTANEYMKENKNKNILPLVHTWLSRAAD